MPEWLRRLPHRHAITVTNPERPPPTSTTQPTTTHPPAQGQPTHTTNQRKFQQPDGHHPPTSMGQPTGTTNRGGFREGTAPPTTPHRPAGQYHQSRQSWGFRKGRHHPPPHTDQRPGTTNRGGSGRDGTTHHPTQTSGPVPPIVGVRGAR